MFELGVVAIFLLFSAAYFGVFLWWEKKMPNPPMEDSHH